MQRFAYFVPFVFSCAFSSQPCDDYVDYMCDCHPEEDCADLATQFSGTDPGLEDECITALADQKDEDDANGLECPTG